VGVSHGDTPAVLADKGGMRVFTFEATLLRDKSLWRELADKVYYFEFDERDVRFVADVGTAVDEVVSAYLRYAPAAEVLK